MSEDATLDDFTTGKKERHTEETIDAVPESTVETSLDETSAGRIPDEWIATNLGDIAEETEYGLTESAEDYEPEKPRYIRTQDFDDFGGLKENSKASLSREKAKDGMLEEGDMLFARSGSVGASLGKTYLYDTADGDCCFGGYSIRHRLKDEGLNHKYILQYTLSDQYWDWVRRRAKTTAQSNINTGEYGSLLIPIPPLPEQRKIATVLYTVDRAIEKTEEIIEQEERVQNGTLNELFTRGVDESGNLRPSLEDSPESYEEAGRYFVPKEWDVDSLQNLCTENITYGIVQPGPHIEDGIPYINTEDMTDGTIPTEGLSKTSQEIAERYSRSEIHTGELVVTIRATIGAVDRVPSELDGANLTRGTARVVPGDSIDNRFLFWAIRSNTIQSELEARVKGTTFDEINLDQLGKIPVPYPTDMSEQSRIVEILSTIDSQLENEKSYLDSLRLLKRGLMQDLLSGTVRTTDTNIEVPEEIAQYG